MTLLSLLSDFGTASGVPTLGETLGATFRLIALPAGDKAAFLDLLDKALAVKDAPGSPRTLANEAMRRRARWLRGTADDLF